MTLALKTHFPGAMVSEVQIGHVGQGTNRRARVYLRYRSGSGPHSVFVKREGALLNRLALLCLGALESEARLFGSDVCLPVEHPEPFAVAVDPRRLATVVVMEDVTLRSGRPNDATVPLTVGQVQNGLQGLARLHAAYWGCPPVESLSFLRPWRVSRVLAPVSLSSLLWAVHRLGSRGQSGLWPSGLSAASLERQFRGWANTARRAPLTLLHGDPHPGNTYALPGEVVGFYDWQLVRTGNWSHDVGYFITSSLEVTDRRLHERGLLSGYLEDLKKEGRPAPQFEDAWRLYRRTPAFGLGTWLHVLAGGTTFQPIEQCLTIIERFAAAYADHQRNL